MSVSKLFKASLHRKYPIIRNKFPQTIGLQDPQDLNLKNNSSISKLGTHKNEFKIKSTRQSNNQFTRYGREMARTT